ncbi:Hypothetical predicted protein [Octopus vulgaris]|uniref:Uncharacterized protein n=1 Tax=Octopus vulgaris TaxID=6645 RepID=A0AA36AX24_OCTVU|nr:Hypothetical predicted protein [Octopus vulgaris]
MIIRNYREIFLLDLVEKVHKPPPYHLRTICCYFNAKGSNSDGDGGSDVCGSGGGDGNDCGRGGSDGDEGCGGGGRGGGGLRWYWRLSTNICDLQTVVLASNQHIHWNACK